MASRLFAYNPEHVVVTGAEIKGDISIQTGATIDTSTLQWYMGPNEDDHPWFFASHYIIPTTTTTTVYQYSIGESALGGKIAYILVDGDTGYDAGVQHGLVAPISDFYETSIIQWGCYDTLISGADGTAIGTGNQNTIDICASCATAGIAARMCSDSTESGYDDWYLPSMNELNKLYLNKTAIGNFGTVSGNRTYWSSSELDAFYAWNQYFANGFQGDGSKDSNFRVRSVRGF